MSHSFDEIWSFLSLVDACRQSVCLNSVACGISVILVVLRDTMQELETFVLGQKGPHPASQLRAAQRTLGKWHPEAHRCQASSHHCPRSPDSIYGKMAPASFNGRQNVRTNLIVSVILSHTVAQDYFPTGAEAAFKECGVGNPRRRATWGRMIRVLADMM